MQEEKHLGMSLTLKTVCSLMRGERKKKNEKKLACIVYSTCITIGASGEHICRACIGNANRITCELIQNFHLIVTELVLEAIADNYLRGVLCLV